MRSLIIGLCFLGLLQQPLFAQEDILKRYAEKHKKKAYCFYPSTLRMVNLEKNPAYNEMIRGIDKLLVYTLDSTATASKSYTRLVEDYRKQGYVEYAAVWGKINLFVYGQEGKESSIVGVFGQKDQSAAFYLDGTIGWEKIPELINTLNENQMLNLFEIRAAGDWHD